MGKITTVKNARLSYPHLFKPADYQGDGNFSYSAKCLVKKGSETDKTINEAITAAAQEAWPKDWQKRITQLRAMGAMKNCYTDGDLSGKDENAGMMVLSAKRRLDQGAPSVIDKDTSPLTEASGRPYAGCFADVSVEIYCQNAPGKEGIRCALRWVQFRADGQAFSGGSAQVSPDEFAPISDEEMADLV